MSTENLQGNVNNKYGEGFKLQGSDFNNKYGGIKITVILILQNYHKIRFCNFNNQRNVAYTKIKIIIVKLFIQNSICRNK